MLRVILSSLVIVATTTVFCTLLAAIVLGVDGSSFGAIVGAVLGMTLAARFLLDTLAIAAAGRDRAVALEAAEREDELRMQRIHFRGARRSLRSSWGIVRFLRQDEEDRRILENHAAIKRLYSQRHHDLDIRDIPGAAHLARKRKRKR